ncbi:HRDC domain-containing protein [uncultured Bifidobacterium sp.]|uniref:HRDC domain-containing protein n=1 Tax=uncultured Bifidobacterium sp. TaxID=165187 RepID=UPI0026144B6F|nr:HRDC domain-containing protein [uncultured Bifidobacterium sp.]
MSQVRAQQHNTQMGPVPRLLREPSQGVPDVVDTADGYRECCERLAAASGPLAVDAERASGFRYGHEDWLIQFKREGAGIILLDPVALSRENVRWKDFSDAVSGAEWILHDAKQDLPGFADLGLVPDALFDTELAARMLGVRRFGLAAVTERFLGVTLAKEHSAADWSYRPIPRDWRNYAALDVELLIDLERVLGAELRDQGKDGWARQEFAHILYVSTHPSPSHKVPWMHISGFTALGRDRRGQAVARSLWMVRDELAREHDIAPSLLLPDHAIIEAARVKPHNGREFRAIRSLNERVRVRTGDDRERMFARYAPIQRQVRPSVWREAIERALELPEDEWPSSPSAGDTELANAPKSMRVWERHPRRLERLTAARGVVSGIARDTRTPADVIIKPQIVRNLCWSDDIDASDDDSVRVFLTQQGARPWQVDLVGESVRRAIM